MEKVYVSGGINWNWYCHVEIDSEGFASVTREYRLHKYDDSQGANRHPKETHGFYRVIENTLEESREVGRIANAIEVETFSPQHSRVKYPFRVPCKRFELGKRGQS